SLCSSCGDCVDICPAQALKIIGEKKTIGQVIQELWKDKDFYFASNGGITCSGGEPMLQIEFLRDLLMEAKSHNLHTAVDTAGAVAYENYAQILKYTDLFLYDIKLFDRQKHKKATGGDNQLILQNIQKLSADGARIIVRTPLIKGINDDLAEIDKIAAFLEPLQIELIQLLAYHSYGLGKYQNLDIKDTSADFQAPDEDFLNQALEIYHQHGLNAEIG
ncbi:MAG: glycyl-radical enzyme activating protein, partial [Clostridiales bacterium]